MSPTSAALGAFFVVLALGYFVGRARGIEHAGRQWFRAVRRIEATNETVASTVNRAHAQEVTRLLETVRHLRAQLDEATAIPQERRH